MHTHRRERSLFLLLPRVTHKSLLCDHVSVDSCLCAPFTGHHTVLFSLGYMGIKLSKNPKTLFKINFIERLNKLKEKIEKWRTLPISLIGRVNTVKMVSLPRFLYLFQNVPIYIPKSYFKSIDSIIMPFIWGYKAHRISKAHLQKPREHRRLGLPCFLHYYWAVKGYDGPFHSN